MNGQILGDVVIKPGARPTFYDDVSPTVTPRLLGRSPTQYLYQYVPGRSATLADMPEILRVAQKYLWQVTGPEPRLSDLDREIYLSYVKMRFNEIEHNLVATDAVMRALVVIRGTALPQGRVVHGDLTLENVVITPDNQVVFIDPGEARRAVTPALDRSKLLQSVVMRWEERLVHTGIDGGTTVPGRPWTFPRDWPAWATLTDWAFLVTHWVRLVRHWPQYDILSGFQVLAELEPQ